MHVKCLALQHLAGFPWLSGEESAYQCRRYEFDSWVRKSPWKRKWQPTPVILPGRSRGQRSRAGYRPRGRKRTGHNLEINSSNSSRQLTKYLSGHSGTDPRVYRLHITDEETGSERQSLRVSLCEGAEPMTQLLKQHQVTKRRPGRVLQCGAHQLL